MLSTLGNIVEVVVSIIGIVSCKLELVKSVPDGFTSQLIDSAHQASQDQLDWQHHLEPPPGSRNVLLHVFTVQLIFLKHH